MGGRKHADAFVLAVVLSGLLRVKTTPRPLVLSCTVPGISTVVVPGEPGMAEGKEIKLLRVSDSRLVC